MGGGAFVNISTNTFLQQKMENSVQWSSACALYWVAGNLPVLYLQ